jgi:hypothetical protein
MREKDFTIWLELQHRDTVVCPVGYTTLSCPIAKWLSLLNTEEVSVGAKTYRIGSRTRKLPAWATQFNSRLDSYASGFTEPVKAHIAIRLLTEAVLPLDLEGDYPDEDEEEIWEDEPEALMRLARREVALGEQGQEPE